MIVFFVVSIIIKNSLTPDNFDLHIKDKKPLVVRFSSEHRRRSVQLNQDWERFSKMYEDIADVRVGHVNCGKFGRLCLRETAWDPPIVRMYVNNTVYQYDGGMSYESLGEWTRRYTGIQGKYIHLDLLSPNNRTFHQLIENKKCVFVMFHNPNCKKCHRFMPTLKSIAEVFRNEDNVSVCEIDSDKYKSFTFDYELRKYPTFNLFVYGTRNTYDGEFNKEDIIDYINDFCDTQRQEDGALNSEVGIIDELSPIVEDFMNKRSDKFINEIKAVPGTELYVEIMNHVLQNGNEYLINEKERLVSIIAEKAASQEALDKLQIRLNVISLFLSYVDFPEK